MQFALDLEVRPDKIVEREIDEASSRVFRFSKMLDEGIRPRDVHSMVVWILSSDCEPDLRTPEGHLFAPGRPREGGRAPTYPWFRELRQRWGELGTGKGFPMSPLEGLNSGMVDPNERCWAFEQLKSIAREILARQILDESLAKSEEWIKGTRSELNDAFGKSKHYPKFLEAQRDGGVLELQTLRSDGKNFERPKFAIRILDPQLHNKIKSIVDQNRCQRG
jgi:hypothetical protein